MTKTAQLQTSWQDKKFTSRSESGQNISHAVMMRKHDRAKDKLEFFPTPPWATRLFLSTVTHDGSVGTLKYASVGEVCCGEGHMSRVISEFCPNVQSSDVFDYGFGEVHDFADYEPLKHNAYHWDWIITNPPFSRAEEIVSHGLRLVEKGVMILVRSTFTETIGRYERLFMTLPPTYIYQYSERVPMVEGRVLKSASTATAYFWLIWAKSHMLVHKDTRFRWLAPGRKNYERESDYVRRRVKKS